MSLELLELLRISLYFKPSQFNQNYFSISIQSKILAKKCGLPLWVEYLLFRCLMSIFPDNLNNELVIKCYWYVLYFLCFVHLSRIEILNSRTLWYNVTLELKYWSWKGGGDICHFRLCCFTSLPVTIQLLIFYLPRDLEACSTWTWGLSKKS